MTNLRQCVCFKVLCYESLDDTAFTTKMTVMRLPSNASKSIATLIIQVIVYVCILTTISSVSMQAQGKVVGVQSASNNESLLWRVSANNKSSYLYGTMHTRDRRVFRFADSVAPCLNSVPYFALEQRLDTLMGVLIDQLIDTTSGLRISDVLTKAQIDSLAPSIAEQLGLPLELIPKMRTALIGMYVGTGRPTKKDKPMFLDAYLFGVARSLQKSVVALEPLGYTMRILDVFGEMQLRSSFNSNSTQRLSQLLKAERMVKYYYKGQIDSLFAMTTVGVSAELNDSLLGKRNEIMARNIDSLTKLGGVFAAMGAAHLSGPRGLIALLRQRGYTVEAVASSYNNRKSLFDTLSLHGHEQWSEYRSERNAFSVRFPAKLAESKFYRQVFSSFEMDIPECHELVSGLTFVVMGMRMPQVLHKEAMESTANTMVQKVVDRYASSDSLKPLSIKYNTMPAFEYRSPTQSAQSYRVMVVFRRNLVYELLVLGDSATISLPMVDTFFHSLQFLSAPKSEWSSYRDSIGGAQVQFPGNVLSLGSSEEDVESRFRYASDTQTGSTFSFTWFDLLEKPKFKSLEAYFKNSLKESDFKSYPSQLQSNFGFVSGPSNTLRLWYHMRDSEDVKTIGLVIVQQRRVYEFRYQYPDHPDAERDSAQFFGSISIADEIPKAQQSLQRIDSLGLSVSGYSRPERIDEQLYSGVFDSLESYYSRDQLGRAYWKISRYHRIMYSSVHDPEKILKLIQDRCGFDSDSIVYKEESNANNVYSGSYQLRTKRALENGYWYRNVYIRYCEPYVYVITEPLLVDDSDHGRSLMRQRVASLQINDTVAQAPPLAQQTWLEDIMSNDTVKVHRAEAFVNRVWFESDTSWYGVLRVALQKDHYDSDSSLRDSASTNWWRATRVSMLNSFSRDSSMSTKRFLAQLAKDETRPIKFRTKAALSLARCTGDSVLHFVLDVVNTAARDTQGLSDDYATALKSAGRDSTGCCEERARIAKLYSTKNYKSAVLDLLTKCVMKSHEPKDVVGLLPAQSMLTKDFNAAFKDYERSLRYPKKEPYDSDKPEAGSMNIHDETSKDIVASFCKWYKYCPADAESKKILYNIAKRLYDTDRDLSAHAMTTLIYIAPVQDTALLHKLVDSSRQSIALLRAVDSVKQRQLLPSRYFTQQCYAQYELDEYLRESEEYENDYDEATDYSQLNYAGKFVTSVVVPQDTSYEKPGRYYLFELKRKSKKDVVNDADTTDYEQRDFKVVGPFAADSTSLAYSEVEVKTCWGVKASDSPTTMVDKALNKSYVDAYIKERALKYESEY